MNRYPETVPQTRSVASVLTHTVQASAWINTGGRFSRCAPQINNPVDGNRVVAVSQLDRETLAPNETPKRIIRFTI
jgi:hypothetical protein